MGPGARRPPTPILLCCSLKEKWERGDRADFTMRVFEPLVVYEWLLPESAKETTKEMVSEYYRNLGGDPAGTAVNLAAPPTARQKERADNAKHVAADTLAQTAPSWLSVGRH